MLVNVRLITFTPYPWGKSLIKILRFFFHRHFPTLIVEKSKKMRGTLIIVPYTSVSFPQSLINPPRSLTLFIRVYKKSFRNLRNSFPTKSIRNKFSTICHWWIDQLNYWLIKIHAIKMSVIEGNSLLHAIFKSFSFNKGKVNSLNPFMAEADII